MNFLTSFFFGTADIFLPDSISESERPILFAEAVEVLCEHGIFAKSDGRKMRVFLADAKRAKAFLDEKNIPHQIVINKSLPWFLYQYRKRYGIFAAVTLFVVLQAVMSNLLLNVEIVGAERYPSSLLKAEVADCGLRPGTMWSKLDLGQIEAEILRSSDRIGWISVNRRGMTAYVEITESDSSKEAEGDHAPCNIVADFDGVVGEMEVKLGKACVKEGNTVKKGDILISGIGPGFSKMEAKGTVNGIRTDRISVFVPREETVLTKDKTEIIEKGLSVFGFEIFFFKKYRNSDSNCDIIEKSDQLLLPNGKALPIALLTAEKVSYCETVVYRSENEMIAVAKSRMQERLLAASCRGDVLSMSSSASFSAEGYTLTVDFTYTSPMGITVPITVE